MGLELNQTNNLQRVIDVEKNGLYKIVRGGDDYIRDMKGLEASLNYIKTLSSNLVVDVGTGKGIAWAEIKNEYGNGLQFWATGLVSYKDLSQRFDNNFIITSAESMKGFNNESVGGIIAVCSIAYGVPELVIKRFDEILVSGGLIKARFRYPGTENALSRSGFKTHKDFTEELLGRNYDVEVINDCIVLAIKPGGKESAADLSKKDMDSYIDWIKSKKYSSDK